MKMLSMKRPRPSIEISTPAVTSLLVKASAVKVEDLDVMIAAIVDELAPNLMARNSIGHVGADRPTPLRQNILPRR